MGLFRWAWAQGPYGSWDLNAVQILIYFILESNGVEKSEKLLIKLYVSPMPFYNEFGCY